MARRAIVACVLVVANLSWGIADVASGSDPHLFVLTGSSVEGGSSAVVGLQAPWPVQNDVATVGYGATVRHFRGEHFVVNPTPVDDIQVIDAATFTTNRRFAVGAGTNPCDIALIDAHEAYVSRFDSRWLLRVDPSLGVALDSLELGIFADADGLPEMGMMALDGDHLFVQIRRQDRGNHNELVPPSLLAVVDVRENEILDVDPDAPGTQGIVLSGLNPSFRMHVDSAARRLYVSAAGWYVDAAGGVEEIDLDDLVSRGFVISEFQPWWPDIGAFAMVSPDKGYVVVHTDLVTSSHIMAFSRLDGSIIGGEIYVTFGVYVQSMAFDSVTGLLYFPDSNPTTAGVHVFDTVTDTRLTTTPLATHLPPLDLVVARPEATSPVEQWPAGNTHLLRAWTVSGTASKGPEIRIQARVPVRLDISIFDFRGRLVRVLQRGQAYATGISTVVWLGDDLQGERVASGVYLFRITSEHGALSGKLTLVR